MYFVFHDNCQLFKVDVDWRRTHRAPVKKYIYLTVYTDIFVWLRRLVFYNMFHPFSQQPHQHNCQTSDDESNYCRNPDKSNHPSIDDSCVRSSPWCYTTHPLYVWEYCGVPMCGECGVVILNNSIPHLDA